MSQCWNMWSADNIPAIKQRTGKEIYKEAKTAVENQKVMEHFALAAENQGAVLFAVCRGKISEGMDFSDNAARTVIVIGVPFPSVTSTRVMLKREYLDRNARALNINGATWYTQEAMKAVNQSIGRVIRHAKDYGAVMLVDQRYSSRQLRNYLSKWLRDQVKVADDCEQSMELLKEFFSSMNCEVVKAPKIVQRTLKFKPVSVLLKSAATKPIVNKKPEIKKRKQLSTNIAFLDKYKFKTKEEAKAESKEKWMKEAYDLISKSLGKTKLKEFMRVFQDFLKCRENKPVSELAQTVYELFRSKNGSNANITGQDNEAMRKTIYFVSKEQRKEYKECLNEMIENNRNAIHYFISCT
eukprot:TRINITY_DN2165_c0_g1_i10.p1 TRINITY_DN2165_c0_g1~~TRINITY_DN2165_c0_g1_i10.p1  ORF type:complete len:354 (-),score=95.11 TRINITY_DN2165_c0_g1_i10:45-1106(-)